MEYLKVIWTKISPNGITEVFIFYYEVDEEGYEVRKIQNHPDGRYILVQDNSPTEDFVSDCLVGTVEEWNENPEFKATLITKKEFDEFWEKIQSEQA